jgi:hypothetical protein
VSLIEAIAMPNFEYDVFEKFPDGKVAWKCCVLGIAAASEKVEELAKKTKNEVFATRVSTQEIVARANVQGS